MNGLKRKRDIVFQSLKYTFSNGFWRFMGISSILGCAGMISLIWKLFENNHVDIIIYCLIAVLVSTLLRFIFYILKFSFVYVHNLYMESQWGNMLCMMNNHQHKLKALMERSYDEKDIKTVIVNILNEQSQWLSLFTGADCSLSVKVPKNMSAGLNSWELDNLFRDSSHSSRDTDLYHSIKHTIIHNTPFSRVIAHVTSENSRDISYVNENIPKSDNYDNTSISVYKEKDNLPYKSEIVSPIMVYELINTKKCNGFLCMDCEKADCFGTQKKYLCVANEMLAEMIYPIINKIQSCQKKWVKRK